jgi:hypothetical protein
MVLATVIFAAIAAIASLVAVTVSAHAAKDQRRAVLGDRLVELTKCVARTSEDINGPYGAVSRAWLGAVLASIASENLEVSQRLFHSYRIRHKKTDDQLAEITEKAFNEIEDAFSSIGSETHRMFRRQERAEQGRMSFF